MGKKRYCLIVCLVAVLILVAGGLSISTAHHLSEIDQIEVDFIIVAFETDDDVWAMGILEDFAEENRRLAAIAICELCQVHHDKGMMAIVNLALTYPDVSVCALWEMACECRDMHKTEPEAAEILEAMVTETVIELVAVSPVVAATAIVSIAEEWEEEMGDALDDLQEAALVAGLQQTYLTAASPIAPELI